MARLREWHGTQDAANVPVVTNPTYNHASPDMPAEQANQLRAQRAEVLLRCMWLLMSADENCMLLTDHGDYPRRVIMLHVA